MQLPMALTVSHLAAVVGLAKTIIRVYGQLTVSNRQLTVNGIPQQGMQCIVCRVLQRWHVLLGTCSEHSTHST
jgi:hypothetical protein